MDKAMEEWEVLHHANLLIRMSIKANIKIAKR